ncbi:MAG: hypothetical protein M3R59_05380 [Verrucomicrobiota bacterium]|nr:hypothetical protein [Verrucomicrobiota bacterium]
MPRQHVWIEREEDGVKREVRATWFSRTWRLQAKRADEETWTYFDRVPLPDLLALKDLIERKYRRRRATIDELEAVQKLVRDHDE